MELQKKKLIKIEILVVAVFSDFSKKKKQTKKTYIDKKKKPILPWWLFPKQKYLFQNQSFNWTWAWRMTVKTRIIFFFFFPFPFIDTRECSCGPSGPYTYIYKFKTVLSHRTDINNYYPSQWKVWEWKMGILYLNECLWKYLFYLRTTIN